MFVVTIVHLSDSSRFGLVIVMPHPHHTHSEALNKCRLTHFWIHLVTTLKLARFLGECKLTNIIFQRKTGLNNIQKISCILEYGVK